MALAPGISAHLEKAAIPALARRGVKRVHAHDAIPAEGAALLQGQGGGPSVRPPAHPRPQSVSGE